MWLAIDSSVISKVRSRSARRKMASGLKTVILGRRAGHAHLRGKPPAPQADDRDRRPADPLAHHEDLRRHGLTDFVICLGYRGYMIKEFFANYLLHNSDVTIDAATGEIVLSPELAEPWRVTLVDTGEATMTGAG
jgi:hypothetical protein